MSNETNWPDLSAADRNWIQFACEGEWRNHHGPIATRLLDCPDFDVVNFAFSVWEITGMRVVTERESAVMLAVCKTLDEALTHMSRDRVLVYNRAADLSAKGNGEVCIPEDV